MLIRRAARLFIARAIHYPMAFVGFITHHMFMNFQRELRAENAEMNQLGAEIMGVKEDMKEFIAENVGIKREVKELRGDMAAFIRVFRAIVARVGEVGRADDGIRAQLDETVARLEAVEATLDLLEDGEQL